MGYKNSDVSRNEVQELNSALRVSNKAANLLGRDYPLVCI